MNSMFLAGMMAAFLTAGRQAEDKWHPVVEYLSPGKWSEGEKRFSQNIPDDENRFGLGVLRILTSFEHLVKGLYDYGFLSQYAKHWEEEQRTQMYNPNPPPINDRQAGDLIRQFIQDLEAAEATLAEIQDQNVKLRVPVGKLLAEYQKSFGANPLIGFLPLSMETGRPTGESAPKLDALVIAFDKADVTWLRGYCHIVLALSETLVACDWKVWFDQSAHLAFPKVDGPYPFLSIQFFQIDASTGPVESSFLFDLPAVIAKADAPVTKPERLKKAHQHLLTVIAMSRQMWKEFQAETDDDLEWIPGPKQKSAIGATVTKEMVTMLDELEAILNGELLLPFWRGGGGKGINLKRVFYESKRISLVDWLQGVAAVPFLEEGSIAEGTIWTNLFDAFGDKSWLFPF